MFLPYLEPVRTKVKTLHADIGAGINNGYPPFDIPAKFSTEETNLDSREYPVLHVREPRLSYATKLTGTQRSFSSGKSNLTAVDGTTWKFWNGTAWVTIGTVAGAKSSQVNFMDYALLADGTNLGSWNNVSTFADVADAPVGITQLAVYSNRVFATVATNNVLYFSALRKHTDWTTADDSGALEIETFDGELGMAVTAYNDHIIYFKKHSCHELFGTGPFNFTTQTLSDRIGCIAPRTVVEVQGTLFWLGDEGIYAYNGGTTPQLISYPNVQGYTDVIDATNVADACAGTDGDRYYLCLPINTNARIIITFDTRTGAWHIEDTANFVEFVEFNGTFYGMQSDGQIKKMLGTAGEEIAWTWVSKRFLNEHPSNRQSLRNLYVILTLPTGSALKCAVKSEEGSFTDVQTFSVSANIQLQQIKIPLTVAQDASWYQIKFYGTGPCIIHRFEIQSRVRSDSYNG